MENLIVLSSILIAVILSSILHYRFSKIPLAFIQIALGALIFTTPIPVKLEFETELFMMCIIAPLLFLEGNHVSRISLLKYLKPVILMAMGLVFTTVIGLGFITHALLPAFPYAACFALAAIICPTDAVAVQAIAKGKKLPKGLMTILEGESLLNDAAGILCFNIALVALTTGQFSAPHAVGQFVLTTIGGILVGLIVGYLFVQLRISLIKSGFDNDHVYIFIQLMTPSVIFIAAESIHVSGVIAAVIGGIIHGIERDRISQVTTRLQMGYDYTWGLLSTALNGMVFVMLGYLVPEVTMYMIQHDPGNVLTLLMHTAGIAVLVYIFRFIWVFALYDMFYIPESRFSRMLRHEKIEQEPRPPRFKYALITTVCGVHGTISMAIALTLPHVIYNHQSFATRDDLLFIAAGVVIISLVVAQIVLPLITPEEENESTSRLSFKEARIHMMEYGIQYLQEHTTLENSVVTGNLIRQFSMSLNFYKVIEDEHENPREITRLQAIAMDVEMDVLDQLIVQKEITQSMFNNYVQYTERSNAFQTTSLWRKVLFFLRLRRRGRKFQSQINAASSLSFRNNLVELEKIARKVHYSVVQRLAEEMTRDNKLEIAIVTDNYLKRVQQIERNVSDETISDKETLMSLEVIGAEREIIQKMVERGKISGEIAVELRQSLNYDEMMLLGGYSE